MTLGEWTRESTLELIAKYRERKSLWDPTDLGYFSHRNKAIVWEQLATDIGSSVEETRRRMLSLLASMRRERARVRKSLAGNGEQYKSTWFAYDSLAFLLDRPNPSSFCKNPVDNTYEDSSSKEESEGRLTLAELATRHQASSDSNMLGFPTQESAFIKCEEDSLLEINGLSKTEACEGDAEERSDNGIDETIRKTMKRKKDDKYQNEHNLRGKRPKISCSQSIDNIKNFDHRTLSAPVSRHNYSYTQSFDDCISFGSYVSDKLKTFSWNTKCAVQHAISEILFSADQGRFDTYCEDYSTAENNLKNLLLNKTAEQEDQNEEECKSYAGSSGAGEFED